jgi:hypothetical protein
MPDHRRRNRRWSVALAGFWNPTGRCDQPRLEAGEVVNDERRTIRHQRSDPITRVQPQAQQAGSQAIAEVIERAPRPTRIRRDQPEPIRIGTEAGAKQTARAHRPRQRPSGISGHAATPANEININPLERIWNRQRNQVGCDGWHGTGRSAQRIPGLLWNLMVPYAAAFPQCEPPGLRSADSAQPAPARLLRDGSAGPIRVAGAL